MESDKQIKRINNNMKTLFLALILFSTNGFAFGPWGPWGPYGQFPGYYYPYPPIEYPTFNYPQTIIVQQPPVIERVIEKPPRVIIEEREVEVCNAECERMRRYFRKH